MSWRSKKQSTVALSTAEAEYVALSSAAQECVWMMLHYPINRVITTLPDSVYPIYHCLHSNWNITLSNIELVYPIYIPHLSRSS